MIAAMYSRSSPEAAARTLATAWMTTPGRRLSVAWPATPCRRSTCWSAQRSVPRTTAGTDCRLADSESTRWLPIAAESCARASRTATRRSTSRTTSIGCSPITAARRSTCGSPRFCASAGRATDVGVDLWNLLNTNYTTVYEVPYSFTESNGGTWNQPTAIYPPRFIRLNFTVNF